VVADGVQLMKRLAALDITMMQARPLADASIGWVEGQEGLKVLCGGDALDRPLAEQLLDRGVSLWNMYGPTETTIWSAVCQVDRGAGAVPLGHPIANTQLYLLDRALRPVPVGVAGGWPSRDGLARGICIAWVGEVHPDCFSGEPGAHADRDRARYHPVAASSSWDASISGRSVAIDQAG
jgi:non-ribosomal peptide synthetase component F